MMYKYDIYYNKHGTQERASSYFSMVQVETEVPGTRNLSPVVKLNNPQQCYFISQAYLPYENIFFRLSPSTK